MSWRPLIDLVLSRLEGAPRDWFAVAADKANATPEAPEWRGVLRRWAETGRRLGHGAVACTEAESAALLAVELPAPEGWGIDEVGRLALLGVTLEGLQPAAQSSLVEELFRTGELREQQAVVRGLGYFPMPERFVALGEDVVRTNALTLVEAIACDNPFPAAHFSQLAFNQMVMKALFNGLPLGRVVGLSRRNNADLQVIVRGWVREREVAGRPVPPDAYLILSNQEEIVK